MRFFSASAFLPLVALAGVVAACSSSAPEPAASAEALDRSNNGDDDDGQSSGTVDPGYVQHWVLAPGQTGELTDLDLRADGSYVAQTTSGAESGTWEVVDLGGDWIFNHTLTLSPSSGKSRTFGSEASATEGYAAIYPNQDAHLGFTMLSKSRVDALPASCDFNAQNCGFPNVLSCVPTDSHLGGATCTTGAGDCFAESGCEDPSKACVIPRTASYGMCVPRAADVPACNVAAQDCADPASVCMPHDASQTTGFCQTAHMPCTAASESDCSFYGATCLTNAGRSFCVRKAK